jgi:intraflagellar transport protein 88
LHSFEKKEASMAGPAAINLSFLYILGNEVDIAEKYTDTAIQADRYNAKALVNRGVCHYQKGEFFYVDSIFQTVNTMRNFGIYA